MADEKYQTYYRALYRLSGLSRPYYEALYQPACEALAKVDKANVEKALQRAINTLKWRQGYLLPRFTTAETCYREQDAWTYGLCIAALCHDLRSSVSRENLQKILIPDIAQRWLENYDSLQQALRDFMNKKPGNELDFFIQAVSPSSHTIVQPEPDTEEDTPLTLEEACDATLRTAGD